VIRLQRNRVGRSLAVIACLFGGHGSVADTSASPSAAANQVLSEQWGPFTFSVGQDTAGGVGANLDGQGRTTFGTGDRGTEPEGGSPRFWFYDFPNLAYAATGTWGTAQTTNNASLSLKPGVDSLLEYGVFQDSHPVLPVTCSDKGVCLDANGNPVPLATYPKPYLGTGLSGDAEIRYGMSKKSGTTTNVREFLVGGEAYLVLPSKWDLGAVRELASPRFSATYYHPSNVTSANDIALPSGVKANYLQTEFHTVLGLGPKSQVKLDVKYDGSKPTTGGGGWQNLWTVKAWTPALKFGGVNPSITYQSGANGGFSYDRQVILGVLVEFLDPQKSK
jgi:hypothetical protein